MPNQTYYSMLPIILSYPRLTSSCRLCWRSTVYCSANFRDMENFSTHSPVLWSTFQLPPISFMSPSIFYVSPSLIFFPPSSAARSSVTSHAPTSYLTMPRVIQPTCLEFNSVVLFCFILIPCFPCPAFWCPIVSLLLSIFKALWSVFSGVL